MTSDWLVDELKVSLCARVIHLKKALIVNSDKRIKTNIQDVPDSYSLDTLRNIPVRYYNYKDIFDRGTKKTIGFIAQEVRDVYPIATKLGNSFIPDGPGPNTNVSWTEINFESNITKYKLTVNNLLDNSGNILHKFYASNDLSKNSTELDVRSIENEPNCFIFDKKWKIVFCYGKEVEDFHYLEKQKLFTLNFSATQEIDKIQQAEKTKLATAETKLATAEAEITTLKK